MQAKDLAGLTNIQRAKPLLMIDIDGVISLFGFAPGERPAGAFHTIDGIPHFLSAAAAEHLLELTASYEPVWASGWEEKANEYLPFLLGVPSCQHLSFERAVGKSNAHWKLDAIEAHAGERALAWIDDAFNEACHSWARRRKAPTLLVQTHPAHGLTSREAERLARWEPALAARGRQARAQREPERTEPERAEPRRTEQ